LLKAIFSINPFSLTLAAIFAVILLFRAHIPILDLIELKTYDLRFLSRGSVQPSPAIVLALIDEKSLDLEGRWPWPRSKIAALIDGLSRDGAKVIGFDIGFPEPDENSQLGILNQLSQQVETLAIHNSKLLDFIQESKRQADNDLTLANAIKNSSAAIVLGYFFHQGEDDLGYRIEQQEINQRLERISASKYPSVTFTKAGMEKVAFYNGTYTPEPNLAMLTEAAASSGYFSLRTDPDGIVRWMPLMLLGGEDFFPPLSVLCVWHYLGKPQLTAKIGPFGAEGIQMGERLIPTDETGRLLINYLGPAKTFPHFSISDVLKGNLAKGTFTDKIVLVGSVAIGAHDLRNTPFTSLSPVYPGVEIHATVIDNILTQRFITNPEWSKMYDLFAIILLGVLIGAALPRIGPLGGLLFATTLIMLHIAIARELFIKTGVWLNIVYPLSALLLNYIGLTVYYYATEERERRKIKDAFEHYVAPEVVNEIVKHPEKLDLGGERQVLTVLFTDLRGFTGISEAMESHELVGLLNEYFTVMTDIVLKYRGTLDKYIGDAIMAFYGAPIKQEDHSLAACYTALNMLAALQELRETWSTRNLPQLHMRVGIHTGEVTVGNIGSAKRFNYTVMGDAVNVASRLEGLNKAYGTAILIGESAARIVRKNFVLREVDLVQVAGRGQAMPIYELLAPVTTGLPRDQEKAISVYASGLEAYRQRRWREALQLFAEVSALWEEDGPARTMLERCHIYQAAPPPDEWEGVFEALHK
jgi:adenylate cyclase